MFLTLFTATTVAAQFEAVIFNAEYTFKEGVYLSHESWVANEPDYSWEEVDGEMVQLPEDYRVQISDMALKSGGSIGNVYAISVDGFPYMFAKYEGPQRYHEFAGLRFRGRYAYYRFFKREMVTTTMYAYNPINGQPFREAPVTREKELVKEMLLHVQTGETLALNRTNVYEILADHPDLQRAVGLLSDDDPELRSKLIRAVKLLNEREPLLLRRAR